MPNVTTAAGSAVRQFNKHVLNPLMLRLAGRRHWYAAVIHHTGRTTSKRYETPVVAVRVPDGGFITPLPYGDRVDWLQNVMAAGSASVTADGRTFDVMNPRVLDQARAGTELPDRRRRVFDRFGIQRFVKFDVRTHATDGSAGTS